MRFRYPVILTSGTPYDRGFQYGSQAKRQIDNTVAAYRTIFQKNVQTNWESARKIASGYIPIVESFDPEIMEEIRGIAAGSGYSVEDVMALNVRTEIMLVARAVLSECTALAATRPATQNGHTLIGQNWDWVPALAESCILLVVKQPRKPTVVTFVEAGLVAKVGCNSAGLGLCVNVIVCDRDKTAAGIPVHVMIRRVLDSSTLSEAIDVITHSQRAGSLNYVLAQGDKIVNVEAAAGPPGLIDRQSPESGILAHANHFASPRLSVRDEALWPDSFQRHSGTMARLDESKGRIDVQTLQRILRDHTNFPDSVCRHQNPAQEPERRLETHGSVIMDVSEGVVYFADGRPCEREYQKFEIAELFAAEKAGFPMNWLPI